MSYYAPLSCKQAPFAIDFIVIGAGVAGLATALRLRQSGHTVTVVDKGNGALERKGGAHLPPNLTKLLCEWGFGRQLAKYGLSVRITELRNIDDGHVIGILPWQEDVLHESGADYLVMQYRDLYRILLDAAKTAGVHIHFQLAVTSVQPDSRRPRIVLSNGRTMSAHVIVGADGPRSIVRQSVNGPIQEKLEGHSIYVAAISRDQLKDDPELYELTAYNAEIPRYTYWIGDNRHVAVITTDQGKTCSIQAYLPELDTEGRIGEDLGYDGVLVAGSKLKVHCEPMLRRLINRAPTYLRKRLYNREFAEDWVDEHGRLIVISEAAYPIWPFCIQTCSMPVEDAGVLTTLFTYLKSEEQIPYLSQAFHEIRESRVYSIFAKESKALCHLWLPPGPESTVRDEGLKLMMLLGHKGWDENKIRWQWDEICEVFAYHAREAAEDWWVMWGALRERCQMIQMNDYH